MAGARTHAEAIAIVERHVDEALQRVLRSTTDPARGLPRFKRKAEESLDERVLDVLLKLLAEMQQDGATAERLREESYKRIDGERLEAEDKRLRRRLQGIPESAG